LDGAWVRLQEVEYDSNLVVPTMSHPRIA